MDKVKQEKLITMAQERQDWYTFLGIVIGLTPAFSPIHEMGHIIVGTMMGNEVLRVWWTGVDFRDNLSMWNLIAGYTFEHYVWIFLASVWCVRWHRRGWFAYGVALAPAIKWWISQDRWMVATNATLLADMICVILFAIGVMAHRAVMFQYNPKLMRALSIRRYGRSRWQRQRGGETGTRG